MESTLNKNFLIICYNKNMTRQKTIPSENIQICINQITLDDPNYKKLTIFTDDADFIGEIRFDIKEKCKLMIVNQVYARQGFGQTIYDSLAMYAELNNMGITCTRSGDIQSEAQNNYSRMYEDNKYFKQPLSEAYEHDFEEFTSKEDNPEMYQSYSLTATDIFKEQLSNSKSIKNNIIYNETITNLNNAFIEHTPFLAACEHGSEIFDKKLPLKETKKLNLSRKH
jgi:hypothetical protein